MSNAGHVYAKQTLNGLYTLYIDGVEVAKDITWERVLELIDGE